MRSSWMVWLLGLTALSSAIWFAFEMGNILKDMTFSDFTIYFNAAERVRDGKPLYDVPGMRVYTFDPFYKYPPLEAHFLSFFIPFGLRNMALLWFYVSILFYVGALIIWIVIAKIPIRSPEALLLICMLLSSQPAVDSLQGPQMDAFMLFLLFIFYWGIVSNRTLTSGISMAILSMIKVFPAVLLLPLIQSRRYRYLITFGAALVSLLLVSILLAGIQPHLEFLYGVLPANAAGSAYVENQSLFGFLSRFFVNGSDWNSGRPVNLPAVAWVSRLISILMLIFMVRLNEFKNRPEFAAAALLVWLLLALPVVWIHYHTLLFFPFALFLHFQNLNRKQDTLGWFLLALSWACIAFGNQSVILEAPVLLQSYKFYGVLILWFLYVRGMINRRATESSQLALK